MGNLGALTHMIVRVGSQTLGLVRFRTMLQGTCFLLVPFTSTRVRSFGNMEFYLEQYVSDKVETEAYEVLISGCDRALVRYGS